MPGFLPLIGRRHFLATTLVGTIAAIIPMNSAQAATTPPSAPGAETLSPVTTAAPGATVAETSVIGAAATAELERRHVDPAVQISCVRRRTRRT